MLRTTNWLKFISRNENCPFRNKVITFFWRGRTINETSALQEWGEHCDLFQRLNLNHFPSWFQIETSTLTSQSNHTLCVESAHLIWNAAFRLFSWFDLPWFWLALSYNVSFKLSMQKLRIIVIFEKNNAERDLQLQSQITAELQTINQTKKL